MARKSPPEIVPIGRPSLFTPELAEEICEAIASRARGLDFILNETEAFPCPRTVHGWLRDGGHPDAKDNDPDKFAFLQSYLRARERQADLIFDECLPIADDASGDGERDDNGKETQHATEQVARSKLRVDTRLRMAGKLAPKKYGDKLELAGSVDFKGLAPIPTPAERLAEKAAWTLDAGASD